jgi:hypothetical protein
MGYYLYLKFLLNNILMLGILGQDLYQPRLSNITNVAPGGSANQIAVFTSN